MSMIFRTTVSPIIVLPLFFIRCDSSLRARDRINMVNGPQKGSDEYAQTTLLQNQQQSSFWTNTMQDDTLVDVKTHQKQSTQRSPPRRHDENVDKQTQINQDITTNQNATALQGQQQRRELVTSSVPSPPSNGISQRPSTSFAPTNSQSAVPSEMRSKSANPASPAK